MFLGKVNSKTVASSADSVEYIFIALWSIILKLDILLFKTRCSYSPYSFNTRGYDYGFQNDTNSYLSSVLSSNSLRYT